MNFKILSYLFLVFIVSNIVAQPVKINGFAPGAEGKTVNIKTYIDQFTFSENILAKAIVDQSGHFSMNIPIENTLLTKLRIDFSSADFYIEPNKTYDLRLDSMNYSIDGKSNPFINTKSINLHINNDDKTELNNLIQQFNLMFNEFTVQHFNQIYVLKEKKEVDTFRIMVNKAFPDMSNTFFSNYLNYTVASLVGLTQYYSKKGIAKKYFINQPILYNNPAYMSFFNEYFSKYIIGGSPKIPLNDIDWCVNKEPNLDALVDSVGKDTLLKNEVLREFVILKGLYEMYYSPNYIQKNVLMLIDEIALKSKFNEHKVIAKNIQRDFNKLRKGTTVSDFVLQDINGVNYGLKDFKGKYTFIIFWASWCTPCIMELDAISKVKDNYSKDINFIAISADIEFLTLKYYLEKKTFGFPILYFNNNWDLLESYNVKAFPQTMLIDREGKIAYYSPPLPSQGMERFLKLLLFDKGTKKEEKKQ